MKLYRICIFIIILVTLSPIFRVSYAQEASYGLIPDYPLWEPPADAIHIDPDNDTDTQRDGTIEHPYISFTDNNFPWFEGAVYALKRGTTLEGPLVEIKKKRVTIASYGESLDRPKYISTSTSGHVFFTWDATRSDITIRDIEIEAREATSCIRLMRAENADGIKIINCKLRGGSWGLRLLFTSNVLVENTEIYDTADDGMFIQGVNHLEIRNCYVHHVNTNWLGPETPETEAGGDGIQLDRSNHWHVHHNYIDRTSSGNKFCFISNNADQNDGILEHNYMTGPLVNGSTIYMHDGSNMIIRYNIIKGPASRPFYSHGTNIHFYGNIIQDIDKPAYVSQTAFFYNNVFYNTGGALSGGAITSKNNIFVMAGNSSPYGNIKNLNTAADFSATDGDPHFVDPGAGDFHLRPQSPCINQGITTEMHIDMEQNQIPFGVKPDVGAYEYVIISTQTQ